MKENHERRCGLGDGWTTVMGEEAVFDVDPVKWVREAAEAESQTPHYSLRFRREEDLDSIRIGGVGLSRQPSKLIQGPG